MIAKRERSVNKQDMRHFTRIAAAASVILISNVCASAQTKRFSQDLGFTVGTNVPLGHGEDSDVIVGVTYGRFYPGGCGFRTGFQYSPSVMDIDNYFGVPMAFAFRTGMKSTAQRFDTAFNGTADSYYDNVYWDRGVSPGGMIADFLVNLFSQAELFAGITPGYVSGASEKGHESSYYRETWTEKPHSFSLTLDVGGSINYKIWRFDLKAIPAFHYCLTDNYEHHSALVEGPRIVRDSSQPVKWFFTISGCLAFNF